MSSTSDGPNFDDQERRIFDQLQLLFERGFPYADGGDELKAMNQDSAWCETVDKVVLKLSEYQAKTKQAPVIGPDVSVEDQLGGWYVPGGKHDLFWPSLERHLRSQEKWRNAVDSIDRSSRLVTSLLGDPHASSSKVRGLVVGYVQSGKTANFTATIAKAADRGYKLFIVLSGIHNSLRRQTQVRMDEELRDLNPPNWSFLTDEERDFGGHLDVAGLTSPQFRTLVVVKKNKSRLERLAAWLEHAADLGILERCPVLVIDDEADQATVNTAKDVLHESTRIHELVKRIVNTPPKCTYVGYTATPFANVLMNAKSEDTLYPKDWIAALPKPEGYFGSADIFNVDLADPSSEPDGYDIVRYIDESDSDELDRLAPFDPPNHSFEMPALSDAVRWFLLATAARKARGQHKHSSMLIHTSARIDEHEKVLTFVDRSLLPELERSLHDPANEQHGKWKELWDSEVRREPAQRHGCEALDFAKVEEWLPWVLDHVKTVMDNSRSIDRLVYGDDPLPVIAVGGNTLSRGLTLEGLVCSYFARGARTYDALLQMGRWFGYRPGYEDLPRVWTSKDLWDDFRFLSLVEDELRVEIKRYFAENLRPGDVALRIRTHPKLMVAAKNKLQLAVQGSTSFGGRHPQTTYFKLKDKTWLEGNEAAAKRLITAARTYADEEMVGPNVVLRDIPWSLVEEFLSAYRFHDSSHMTTDSLKRYVGDQLKLGALSTWNIAVMSKKQSGGKKLDLGLTTPVTCITRSRLGGEEDSIGTLMSRPDRLVDLGEWTNQLSDEEMLRLRDEGGPPLLALYPIDGQSKVSESRTKNDPKRGRGRVDLEASSDVVAVGFSFPSDHPNTPFGGNVIQLGSDYLEAAGADIAEAGENDLEGDFVDFDSGGRQ